MHWWAVLLTALFLVYVVFGFSMLVECSKHTPLSVCLLEKS